MTNQKITITSSILAEKARVEGELVEERERRRTLEGEVGKMEGIVEELERLRKPTAGNGRIVETLKGEKEALERKVAGLEMRVGKITRENRRILDEKDLKVSALGGVKEKDKKDKESKDKKEKNDSDKRDKEVDDLKADGRRKDGELARVRVQLQRKIEAHDTLTTHLASLPLLPPVPVQIDTESQDRERAVFISALEGFEKEVDEVHRKVVQVTRERDEIRRLYEQVVGAKKSVDVKKGDEVRKEVDGSSIQLLKEANLARDENKRLTELVSGLEGQVSALTADLSAIIARQRENGAQASTSFQQLENELAALAAELETCELQRKEMELVIGELEERVKDGDREKDDVVKKGDGESRKNVLALLEIDRLKMQAREMKAAKTAGEDRVKVLEKEREEFEKRSKENARLLGDQRLLLNEIDSERDRFQIDLDDKAESILGLEEINKAMNVKIAGFEAIVGDLRGQVDALTGHLNNSDRECNVLGRQLHESMSSAKGYEEQSQQYHLEAQRLASDLVALTRENQILNGELGECSGLRDRYHGELVECEGQVHSLNELVKGKEEERNELMANYRKLIGEHERLDIAYRTKIEELDHLRMEVVTRDKKIASLDRQLDTVSRDATQFQIDNNAHSKQTSNMSRALATSDRQIKQLEADKLRLGREIQASRDVAHSVDRSKDSLQSQHIQLNLEHDRLLHTFEKNQVEMVALEAQLNSEMLKAERLEQYLNMERTKQMQTERSGIEMKNSQVTVESRLKELTGQQQMALNISKTQLDDARISLAASLERVSRLESLLGQKEGGGENYESAQAEILALKEQIRGLDKNVKSLVELHVTDSDSIQARIIGELHSTQREKEHANQLIEHTLSPSGSASSLASKETTGNNDHSPYNRRVDQAVLETIVQCREDGLD